MKPIETKSTDTTYAGVPSRGVGELPTETGIELLPDGTMVRRHRSFWIFDDEEKAALLLGSGLVLDILGEAVPPIRPAVAAPPLDETVETGELFAAIDRILNLSIGVSIAGVLSMLGIEKVPAEVAAWSDAEKKEVGDWCRLWTDVDGKPVPPDGPWPVVLGLDRPAPEVYDNAERHGAERKEAD